MMGKIKKKYIAGIIKLIIGLAIIIILLKKFDFNEVWETLRSIPPIYVLSTILLYMIINLVSVFKIALLLKSFNKDAPFWGLFKDYSLSWALGLFVPAKLGEFSLIYLLKEYKIDTGPSTAIVLLEKLSALIILLPMSVIGFFMFFTKTDAIKALIILTIIYVLFFFFIFSKYGRDFIKKYILRKKSKKFKGFSKSLFFLMKENKSKMIYIFLLAPFKWIINAFMLYIILLYFKQPVNYFQVLFIFSVVTVIASIPITFNGLGLRESSAVILFSLINVNALVTLSSSLYLLVIAYLLGIFHFLISIKRIKEIK